MSANWWGSNDDTTVRASILDSLHSPNFMRTQYHPYCLDASCSSLSAENTSSWQFFQNGSVIGGYLTQNVTIAAGNYTCFGFNVLTGYRLEFQAGVTCRFMFMSTLIVNGGVLSMLGTAAQPIVLTSAQALPAPGDWGTVWIRTTQPLNGSAMSYVQMSYGGLDRYISEGANLQYDAPPQSPVSNLLLTYSRMDGLRTAGYVDCAPGYFFSDIQAHHNTRFGFYAYAYYRACLTLNGGSMTYNGNHGIYTYYGNNLTFSNIDASNNVGSGFYLTGTYQNTAIIENSTFNSNQRWGFYFTYSSYYTITIVRNCTIKFNGSPAQSDSGGIGLYAAYAAETFLISNNVIESNNNTALSLYGGYENVS
jgi:hypothetical protein